MCPTGRVRETWKLRDRPDSWKPKRIKVQTHPPLTEWKSLPPDQAEVFHRTAETIRELAPAVQCYVYGSRLHGTWTEKSDYDILIVGETTREQRDALHEFQVRRNFYAPANKIDLKFGVVSMLKNQILIP